MQRTLAMFVLAASFLGSPTALAGSSARILETQPAAEATLGHALTEPGAVDEIRIRAGGGKPYRERELARQPVRLRWTNAGPAQGKRAPWVEEALAHESVALAIVGALRLARGLLGVQS